jgi:hypothetical protein
MPSLQNDIGKSSRLDIVLDYLVSVNNSLLNDLSIELFEEGLVRFNFLNIAEMYYSLALFNLISLNLDSILYSVSSFTPKIFLLKFSNAKV